jgi:hypothetical protein
MANCESNILDLPLRITAPAATDVVIITHSDGTSEIVAWATLIAAIAPTDVEFRVGETDYPEDGDSTMTLASNINRIRVIRGHVPQATINDGGGYYYSFNPTTKLLTFHPNLTDEELIQIQPY